MIESLQKAISAIESGDKSTAYRLLVTVIRANPKGKDAESAWLWMSRIFDDKEKKRKCLETVLSLNPENTIAKNELQVINSNRSFVEEEIHVEDKSPEAIGFGRPIVTEESQKAQSIPIKWLLAAVFIIVVCLCAVIPFTRLIRSQPKSDEQPQTNISASIKLPATYTPISQQAVARQIPSNNPPPNQDCKGEAAYYIEQISPSIYSFAQITNLAYEVTSDIGMIPILTELEDLKSEFASIPQASCIQQYSRTISIGMDNVLTAITDFTIGASDADTATIAVHNGLTKMLDGFEQLATISNQAISDVYLPTLTPSQSQAVVLPTPTTVPPTVALPTLTRVTGFSGTESEFVTYIRNNFSSISGQSLAIENITVYNEGGEYPHRSVSIELSNNSAGNVFAAQTVPVTYEYGQRLLDTASTYFGGQDFMVRVFEVFYDDYLSDRYFDDDWYYIGSYYLDEGWAIQRDYVIGHVQGGNQSLRVWNNQ